jgi:hypothetical protein
MEVNHQATWPRNRCRWDISSTQVRYLWLHVSDVSPRGKSPSTLLGGPHSQSKHYGDEDKTNPAPAIYQTPLIQSAVSHFRDSHLRKSKRKQFHAYRIPYFYCWYSCQHKYKWNTRSRKAVVWKLCVPWTGIMVVWMASSTVEQSESHSGKFLVKSLFNFSLNRSWMMLKIEGESSMFP